jgi:hypothetical protein
LRRETVAVGSGAEDLVKYHESSPGEYRGFCSVYGSNLISKFDAKPTVYGLALGVLDDDRQQTCLPYLRRVEGAVV